jgi:hypothetical protein
MKAKERGNEGQHLGGGWMGVGTDVFGFFFVLFVVVVVLWFCGFVVVDSAGIGKQCSRK